MSIYKKLKKICCVVTLSILGGELTIAFAQSAPDAGALQQQFQRQIEKDSEKQAAPIIKKNNDENTFIEKAPKQTIFIKNFIVTGATLVLPDEIDKILEPFKNKDLTVSQIKEAAFAISAHYQSIGKVAQAIVPPQDILGGIVKIQVIEGHVGEIKVEDLPPDIPSRIPHNKIKSYIEKTNPKGQLIDLEKYEHSLGIINDLPGTIATGDLEQGEQDGTSNIVVSVHDSGLLNGRIDVTNFGSASTGVPQAVANINFNNIFHMGDLLTLDAIGTQGSTYGQFRFGVPIGLDGWRIAVGGSALSYETLSDWSSTIAQGNANVLGMYLSYPVSRGAVYNTTFVTNLENKNYQNFATSLGNQATVSDYYINAITPGLYGNILKNEDFYSWGAYLTVGDLTMNNATQLQQDTSSTGAFTVGTYEKLAFNASYKTPIPFPKSFIQFSFMGQLASKNLNSAEQFYLGGPYGVRAYPLSQGGGSQGFTLLTDITHTLADGVTVGAFFDIGGVQQYVNTVPGSLPNPSQNADNFYYLYSTGLTAKYNMFNGQVQLSGTLAYRVGDNPLFSVSNGSYQQINSDNQYRAIQAWVKGTFVF